MIKLENLTVRIAGRTLIEKVTLTINEKQHYGLVGRNGVGKSTLFKVLLKEQEADGGRWEIPARLRVGHIAQEVPAGDKTALETVIETDRERLDLLSHLEKAPENLAEIYDRLIAIDAFSAESRAAQILAGLGFSPQAQQTPLKSFSGGWRMRVRLAGLLFSQPDWLLLDEPTNHLDLEATLWLGEYLKNYPYGLLVITHDRYLLNNICNCILHLHSRKLTAYSGNYDTFLNTWSSYQGTLKSQHAKQDAQRKHMRFFVERFGAQASKAKQAQSRLKAIAKMEHLPEMVHDPLIKFDFPSPRKLAPPLLVLEGVDVGYTPGVPVLTNLCQRIDPDDRIALLGANGNGKSTFVKLIAGRLVPQKGEITRSHKLKVGYFAQHQVEEFSQNLTPFEHVLHKAPQLTATEIRNYLGRFGLSGPKGEVRVADLSGGEKVRLNFTMICLEEPNILLLDEPTNHLDMDSRQALLHAINDFPGAVIMITHDWDILESTTEQLWLVADRKVEVFAGDLTDYRNTLLRKEAANHSKSSKSQVRAPPSAAAQQKNAQQAQSKVDALAAELAKINDELAQPSLYSNYSDMLTELIRKKHELEKQLMQAEEVWLKAELAVSA